LEPLILEMRNRQMDVVITAKENSQTIGILHQKGIEHRVIGHHGGKNVLGKTFSLIQRVISLLAYAIREKPDLSVCHGSRELLIVSKLLGIPNVTLFDYEYSEHNIKNWAATLMMVPDVIPLERLRSLGYRMERIYQYPGIKEQIYLNPSGYDPDYVKSFGIDPQKILVIFRPPATESHYHDEKSEELVLPLLRYLDRLDVAVIIMPRYASQVVELKELTKDMHHQPAILNYPIDGPKLLAHADLVISGGGTMIREAAVLQTPAYSIFSGESGAVDEYLVHKDILTWIRTSGDLSRINLVKKPHKKATVFLSSNNLVQLICDKILTII
jgi:uncharacterized protein